GRQLKAGMRVIGPTPCQRRTQVVMFDFQTLQPLRQIRTSFEALGPHSKRPVVERVALGKPRELAALSETGRAISAHRIQQLVARWARVVQVRHQEGLLNQAEDERHDFLDLEALAGADGLGCIRFESASEDRGPAKETPLLVIEKLVIPVK